MLTITTVTEEKELADILALQQQNLARNISREEAASQGYVTVVHTIDQLQKMDSLAPSIIAKDNNQVIGYALAMPKACSQLVPILKPMFANLEILVYKNVLLSKIQWYVMGQVCIDKAYRGQGLFEQLYAKHKEVYSNQYDCQITEVATRNTRSLRAHEKVGFSSIHQYVDETDHWQVLLWDWV